LIRYSSNLYQSIIGSVVEPEPQIVGSNPTRPASNHDLLLGLMFHGHYYKQARLVADRKAAKVGGNRTFLDVLTKIDGMRLNMEKAKHERISSWPGIDRRIHNLQQSVGSTNTSSFSNRKIKCM
jgi:hypothetical protein